MFDAPETTRCDGTFLGAFGGGNGFGGCEGEAGAGCEGAHEAGYEGGHYESHEEEDRYAG